MHFSNKQTPQRKRKKKKKRHDSTFVFGDFGDRVSISCRGEWTDPMKIRENVVRKNKK
jgi:hypothetical protein